MNKPRLWAADPTQWGPGKVHALDDRDPSKTFCGRITTSFPGRAVTTGSVTCRICADAPARRERREAEDQVWRARAADLQKERQRQSDEWWERYNAYLRSPEWREKSQAVLKRANFVCEGCGKARATQAHHVTYRHVGAEFLWELRAVCNACHERAHADHEEPDA